MKQTPYKSGLEWLQVAERRLRRCNVLVDLASSDAVTYLKFRQAEASTISGENGVTILFRDGNPSISCVLEELAHALQVLRHRFEDLDAQEMIDLREIEAKQCLVDHREYFRITEAEHLQTCKQLSEHQDNLRTRKERW